MTDESIARTKERENNICFRILSAANCLFTIRQLSIAAIEATDVEKSHAIMLAVDTVAAKSGRLLDDLINDLGHAAVVGGFGDYSLLPNGQKPEVGHE